MASRTTRTYQKLMRANIALATLSALILVAQTYFLATLLDKLIMQNVPRDELIPYFLGLIIGFGLRAIILWVREKLASEADNYYATIFVKNSG